jgi:hypothetical protein
MKLVSTLAVVYGLGLASACLADTVVLPYQIGGAYSVPVTSMKSARYRSMVRQQ